MACSGESSQQYVVAERIDFVKKSALACGYAVCVQAYSSDKVI